jgi:hypothetical protein
MHGNKENNNTLILYHHLLIATPMFLSFIIIIIIIIILIGIYSGSKFCPSLLETVGLQFPAWYIRDFRLFNVRFSSIIVLLLHALQLLMLFAGTLVYLETKLFLLIVFYTGTFLIIKILIAFNMSVCVFYFHTAYGWSD